MEKPDPKDISAVEKKISNIDKAELEEMEKAKRLKLRLSSRQRRLKKIVQMKIARLSKKEKLKLMTPAGVQKIMDEAEEILKKEEGDD